MAGFVELGSMQQLMKAGRTMPALSDENLLVQTLVEQHNPGGRDYDIKPLLCLVEDILRCITLSSEAVSTGNLASVDQVDDKAYPPSYINLLETLSYKIYRISSEISCKALGGSDAHSTTVAIFDMLTNYKWDVKLVLTLAGFALAYGEFSLLSNVHSINPLAKSIAMLKQLPGIMEHTGQLKPRFDALNDLIKVVMEVIKCVIEFNDLPQT